MKPASRLLLLSAWLIVGLMIQAPVLGSDFHVKRGTTRLVGDTYVLDAHIDYVFSDTALEALDNGVPLTLDVHVQIQREGAWIWEPRPLDRHMRFMIRFHALGQLYQVVDLASGVQQNFVTREAAISALGDITGVELLKKSKLKAGETYMVKVKASLDIEALPLPLRPLAYLSPSWNLSSKWRKWPLQP